LAGGALSGFEMFRVARQQYRLQWPMPVCCGAARAELPHVYVGITASSFLCWDKSAADFDLTCVRSRLRSWIAGKKSVILRTCSYTQPDFDAA